MTKTKATKKPVPVVTTLPEVHKAAGSFPFKAYLLMPNGKHMSFNVTGHPEDTEGRGDTSSFVTDFEWEDATGKHLLTIDGNTANQIRYTATEPESAEDQAKRELYSAVEAINETLKKTAHLAKQYGPQLRLRNTLGLSELQVDLSSLEYEVNEQVARITVDNGQIPVVVGPSTTMFGHEQVGTTSLLAALSAVTRQARATVQVGKLTVYATRTQVVATSERGEFYLSWEEADGVVQALEYAKGRAALAAVEAAEEAEPTSTKTGKTRAAVTEGKVSNG